uniref:Mucin-19-like n=1 Tax=Petromyzon marinus TaxID=7757 RepID=A0AAJ7UBF6_PETMA|nr:mucin-19-like [Petromyzon marinus]
MQIPHLASLYLSLRGERAAVDDHHQQQQQQRQPTVCFIPMDGGHSCRPSSPPAVARGRDQLESLARPELPQPYFATAQTSQPPLGTPRRTTHDDKPAAGAAGPDVPPPRPHQPAGDTTPETPTATGPVAQRLPPLCGAREGAVAQAGQPPGVTPPRYMDQSVSVTITGRSPAMVFTQGRPPVGLSQPSQIADHHQHHHHHYNHLLLGHHVEVTVSQPSRYPPRGQVTADSPAPRPNVHTPTSLPDGPSEPRGLESHPWCPCPDPESGASWTLDLAERHHSASVSGADSAQAGGREPCTANERSTERSTERSYAARVCSVMVERSDSPLSLVTAASHSRLAHAAAAAAAAATAEEEEGEEEKRRSTCQTVIISIDPEPLMQGTSEASQLQQQLDDDAVNYIMPKAAAVAASAATAAAVAPAGVPETVARRDKSEGAVNLSTGEGRRRASPALSSSSAGGGMDLRAAATTRPARPLGSAPDDASGKPSREPLGIAADPAVVNLTTGPSSLAGPCGDDGRHRPAVPHLMALNLARESTRISRSDLGAQAAAAAAARARVPPLSVLVDLSRPRPCQAVPAVRRDQRQTASARPVDLTAAKTPGGRGGPGPREAAPCVVAAEAPGPPLRPCCWRSDGDRPWAPYAPAAAPADVKAVDLTAGRWLAG